MMGDLAHNSALQRTRSVKVVLAALDCSFVTINDEQSGGWLRTNAMDLTNWLTAGDAFDVVFANNEMPIGATQAMKASGIDMDEVIVSASMRPRTGSRRCAPATST